MFKPNCDQCAKLLAERNDAYEKMLIAQKVLAPLRADLGNLRRRIRELTGVTNAEPGSSPG